MDQQEYQKRYTSLVERNTKRESIGVFIKELEQRDMLMDELDEGLWLATVDTVKVYSEREASFIFKDGLELGWKI